MARHEHHRPSGPADQRGPYVAELDQRWRIIRLNKAAEELLGGGDGPIGRDWWEIFPLSSGTYAREILEEAAQRGVSTQFQAYCEDLDGWFQINAAPTPGGLRLVVYDADDGRHDEAPLSDAGLARISEEMRRVADQIVREVLDGARGATPSDDETWTDQRLARIADAIYRDRSRRAEHFKVEFAEPQWNILLDLFIQQVRGVRVSVTSACIAAGVPSTTALRAVQELIAKGLATREADPEDKRRAWIALTPEGAKGMRAYLRDSAILGLGA